MIILENTPHETEERTAASAGLPYWQTEPCPPWCWHAARGDFHEEADRAEDRQHFSRWQGEITLTLEDPIVTWYPKDGKNQECVTPAELEVYLTQQYREIAPRVQLQLQREKGVEVNFTLDEARQLVNELNEALHLAETPPENVLRLRSVS